MLSFRNRTQSRRIDIIVMTNEEKEKIYDAYCDVCGHYAHTTPHHICRHACDYFSDFKTKIEKL